MKQGPEEVKSIRREHSNDMRRKVGEQECAKRREQKREQHTVAIVKKEHTHWRNVAVSC